MQEFGFDLVLNRLATELAKLPGVGSKTALRFALHIVHQPRQYALSLAQALEQTVEKVTQCESCFFLTDRSPCRFCNDLKRDSKQICVVHGASDLLAIESAGAYRGHYHVLLGALSPIDGVGPENLKIKELLTRLSQPNAEFDEVILATNPNITGDATALYLAKLISPLGLKITKLASGIPMGSDIEYIDKTTLSQAMLSRVDYSYR